MFSQRSLYVVSTIQESKQEDHISQELQDQLRQQSKISSQNNNNNNKKEIYVLSECTIT